MIYVFSQLRNEHQSRLNEAVHNTMEALQEVQKRAAKGRKVQECQK